MRDEDIAWLKFVQNAAGAILGPFDAWLVLRGTKTLPLRMVQHSANGLALAEFLAAHVKVRHVHYPGLPAHPQYDLATRQMRGFGGMLAFELGSLEAARRLLNSVRLMSLAESLGGVETLISHPATMTHASVPETQRQVLGITDGLVRISAGIEDIEDLKEDLAQALDARLMAGFLDVLLHVDRYLLTLVSAYGTWVYLLLFLIVFAETGLVVTPFLPGDSLLFAAGAIAAVGRLDVRVVIVVLIAAAVLGDAVNYAVGRIAGSRILRAVEANPRWRRWLNPAHVARAHDFFERHGGKAVVMARFVPIVRTFVPFVAGVAEMSYPSFAFYNVAGAVAWVGLCVGSGYVFGNVPVVQDNFSLVALGIVAVSLLPMVVEYLRHRRAGQRDRLTCEDLKSQVWHVSSDFRFQTSGLPVTSP